MTATPAVVLGFTKTAEGIVRAFNRGLASNAQAGKGQFVTQSPTTGFAALNDGTVPNQISIGTAEVNELSDTNATAGNALLRVSSTFAYGRPNSTATNDAFADTDFAVPFFLAKEAVPGKKSNDSGNNRSLGGLVFGLFEDGTPYTWDGPIAWLLARATLVTDAFLGANLQIADASAGATLAETAVERPKVHGVVTSVDFTGAAISADNTNNVTITVAKRDGAGGAAVTIATYQSNVAGGAVTAFTPKAFTLSGTAANLNLLETDIVTVTTAKAGTGATVTGNVRVNMRAM